MIIKGGNIYKEDVVSTELTNQFSRFRKFSHSELTKIFRLNRKI